MRVLILGGTGEARDLAAALDRVRGVDVVSSLAGRVRAPRMPVGQVRVGGFGGPEKLAEWLLETGVDAVVDATHPFAERISASASVAAGLSGVPLLMLRRPGWTAGPGDVWHRVADLPAAAELLPSLGERVFLTTGRQGLGAFADCPGWFLVRCVDPPDGPLPARVSVLLDRGPYTLPGETALMDAHRIDVLVTKDSGGALTSAKLEAARVLGVPVVVVERPAAPSVAAVETVADVLVWLAGLAPSAG